MASVIPFIDANDFDGDWEIPGTSMLCFPGVTVCIIFQRFKNIVICGGVWAWSRVGRG